MTGFQVKAVNLYNSDQRLRSIEESRGEGESQQHKKLFDDINHNIILFDLIIQLGKYKLLSDW